MKAQSISTRVGDRDTVSHRWWFLRFYRITTTQKWSPTFTEYEIERGIAIGPRRFGYTVVVKYWRTLDGLEHSELGAYQGV